MFNKNFYPTPENLIKKMLDGLDLSKIKTVLEPSAGKGDLIEGFIKLTEENSYFKYKDFDIDSIEIEPELQAILKSKEYRVVSDNFLEFHTFKKYDLILANPPFSEGAKHLLKMIDLQEKTGGSIICLLNAETIKNPFSNERKVLLQKLNEYQANIEFIQNAFSKNAERTTDVEIALVKMTIEKEEKESFFFNETLKKAQSLEYKDAQDNFEETQITENDLIKSFVKQYEIETEAGLRLIDEYQASYHYLKGSLDENNQYANPTLELKLGNGDSLSRNKYVESVRLKYWRALFNNPNFTKRLTNNLISEFQSKVSELKKYEFSLYNINTIRVEMLKNMVKGVEDTILNLFEEFSHKYHWYDEASKNIHYFNGWKTNSAYKINKKVIIPLRAFREKWLESGYHYEPNDYSVISKLSDIEKVFNYLDNNLSENIDLNSAMHRAKVNDISKKIDTKYFKITFFKKGTCHLEFKNDDLLKKFNIFGAKNKNWLPPSYGKKSYEEMDSEEKQIINEFEGENEYKKVLKNTQYFLVKTSSLLELE